MYFNCQKIKAFELFEKGIRPAEAFNKLSLKKQTVYRYFQEWKGKNAIRKIVAERIELNRKIQKRIKDCEKAIHYSHSTQEVAKWQRQKCRAEELLINPFLATPAERKMLEDYSD